MGENQHDFEGVEGSFVTSTRSLTLTLSSSLQLMIAVPKPMRIACLSCHETRSPPKARHDKRHKGNRIISIRIEIGTQDMQDKGETSLRPTQDPRAKAKQSKAAHNAKHDGFAHLRRKDVKKCVSFAGVRPRGEYPVLPNQACPRVGRPAD